MKNSPSNAPPKTSTVPPQTHVSRAEMNNAGGVADQAAATKTAEDAKAAELQDNAIKTKVNAGFKAGENNPADGTPIVVPTGDPTRPDLTKAPLHNPGVVVEPNRPDPSPSTVSSGFPPRDVTDPSRKH